MARKPLRQFDRAQLEKAMQIVRERYGKRNNYRGADVGYRYADGRRTDEVCVRVHVEKKLNVAELLEADVFPQKINGITLDVIEGPYRPTRLAGEDSPATTQQAYLAGGLSCGRVDVNGAGTLGLLVIDTQTNRPGILSNWHVLAGPLARRGDAIIQPARVDGGRDPGHVVATLKRWMLDREGDAAIAELVIEKPWLPIQIETHLIVKNVRRSRLGEVLAKSGRTTGVTRARVDGEGIYRLEYEVRPGLLELRDIEGFKLVALEDGNPSNEEISSGGDSGSLWMSENSGAGVGLHFGGELNPDPAAENALACNLDAVLDRLGQRPATFDDLFSDEGIEAVAHTALNGIERTARPEDNHPPPWLFAMPYPWSWGMPVPQHLLNRQRPPWPVAGRPQRWRGSRNPDVGDVAFTGPEAARIDRGPAVGAGAVPQRATRCRSITRDLWPLRLRPALLRERGFRGVELEEAIAQRFCDTDEQGIASFFAGVVNGAPEFGGIGLPMVGPGDFFGTEIYSHVCERINDVLAEG